MLATIVKLMITTLISQFVKTLCYKINDVIFRNNRNNVEYNQNYRREYVT